MPTYTFRLMDDDGGVADNAGLRLADAKVAYGHACVVAHELMDHREARTRSWRPIRGMKSVLHIRCLEANAVA
jgi:hypothetical protein